MTDLSMKIQKFEFEFRIFISFGLVILISALSFSVFAGLPDNSVALGGLLGIPASRSRALGYLAAALFMAGASCLRIWSGSVLTSRRMMSFAIKTDALLSSGPYQLVRNPIYLAGRRRHLLDHIDRRMRREYPTVGRLDPDRDLQDLC